MLHRLGPKELGPQQTSLTGALGGHVVGLLEDSHTAMGTRALGLADPEPVAGAGG